MLRGHHTIRLPRRRPLCIISGTCTLASQAHQRSHPRSEDFMQDQGRPLLSNHCPLFHPGTNRVPGGLAYKPSSLLRPGNPDREPPLASPFPVPLGSATKSSNFRLECQARGQLKTLPRHLRASTHLRSFRAIYWPPLVTTWWQAVEW